MEQDMGDIESQTIYKETLEETSEILHNGKRPVVLKVCMYACLHFKIILCSLRNKILARYI